MSGVRLQATRAVGALAAAIDKGEQMNQQHTAARRWFTASGLSFDSGAGDAQDLLLAALMLAKSDAELLQASEEAQLALADLAAAIGVDPRTVK